MRFLDVRGAFAVQSVGGRELALDFDLGFLFPAQFERGLALVAFECGDPALEFLDLPRVFLRRALRAGRLAGEHRAELAALLRFGDLLGKRRLLLREGVALHGQFIDALAGFLRLGDLRLESGEFPLERLRVLLRFGEVLSGLGRHAFLKRDLVGLVIRRGFRPHHFRHEPFALRDDFLPLLRDGGELPLELAFRPRELRPHGFARAEELLAGKFVVVLKRGVERGAGRLHRERERAVVGDDPHVGDGRNRGFRCGGRLAGEFQRRLGRGRRRRRTGRFRHAGEGGADCPLLAHLFGERIGSFERQTFGTGSRHRRGARVGQHAHHLLPGEADFRLVGGEDFLPENLRRAPVKLGEGNGRLAAGDAVGEFGDVKPQLRPGVVRAVVEEVLRDAREKIAEI